MRKSLSFFDKSCGQYFGYLWEMTGLSARLEGGVESEKSQFLPVGLRYNKRARQARWQEGFGETGKGNRSLANEGFSGS